MDELRNSTLETEDSILASYESQRPDSNFTFFDQVYGPPTLIQDQLAEGFVGEGTFSYILKVFPSANEFTALGLPAGISKFKHRWIMGNLCKGWQFSGNSNCEE